MEFIITIVLLIVIFILVLSIQNRQQNNSIQLSKNLNTLYKEIQQLKKELIQLQFKPPAANPVEEEQKEKAAAETKTAEEIKQRLAAIEQLRREKEEKKKADEEKALKQSRAANVEADDVISAPEINQKKSTQPPPKVSRTQTWLKNNPDLEKFIGENLVSKIGIGVLVLAIGFFVKYAIDKNWVGSVSRVSIGIICGGILIALAHKMRNSYKAFSSVLAGGGLAVFYFTITLAYHQFHLFSQTTAFIIMIVITAFAVLLSLLYNRQELAIIALVGGFTAPFLVSDGSHNYKTLFTYLIVLNTGLLVIAYNKSWRLLNLLSFIFTVIIYGSWLIMLPYNEKTETFKYGFLFASIFCLLFFVINIAHNIREKKRFIVSDFSILLAGTALYFGAGIYCLNEMHAREFRGLFSASMGVFNLMATWFLFRKQKVDTNILYLLIGLTLTFISVTAPLQLHGNYITLFWASEAVLLYWLFTKANMRIIQYASVLVWVLMLFSLLIDWGQLYIFNSNAVKIIANKGFITALFAAVGTYLLYLLRNKETEKAPLFIPGKKIFRISAVVLFFVSGLFEISYQFNYYYPGTGVTSLYLLLYMVAFILVFTIITQKVKQLQINWAVTAILLAICILLYVVSLRALHDTQAEILLQNRYKGHFMAHWITALFVGAAIVMLIRLFRKNREKLKGSFDVFSWVCCIVVVVFLSAEMHLVANRIFYSVSNPLDYIQRVYIKTGLPILWGLCSFAFMWLGMKYKYRTLRIISLSLFLITLLKLFIFDIRNIPAGGKIAAFFCLGVLLLVVSFMYQRLKKIIIDDEKQIN